MAASATFAEDELGRKWDKCLTDAVLKMGKFHDCITLSEFYCWR